MKKSHIVISFVFAIVTFVAGISVAEVTSQDGVNTCYTKQMEVGHELVKSGLEELQGGTKETAALVRAATKFRAAAAYDDRIEPETAEGRAIHEDWTKLMDAYNEAGSKLNAAVMLGSDAMYNRAVDKIEEAGRIAKRISRLAD